MDLTGSYAEQTSNFSFYVHDDWKISRKLTLNLGLPYEYESPITERYNRSVAGYAFDTANPLDAAARENYAKIAIPERPVDQYRLMGGLTFAGVGGNSRQYWKGENNNLMPRVGFAYQLSPLTVLRGGFGMFYSSMGILTSSSIQTGFSQSTPIQASLDSGLSFIATTANPFPNGLQPLLGAAGGLMTNIGQNISFFPEERKHPYTQKWSFGIQRQLPAQYLIDVSYVGSKSVRLGVDRDLSFTPAEYLSKLPYRDETTIEYLSATFPNPLAGLHPIFGANTSRAGLLDPYPHFGNVTILDQPVGYSWYHSMQTRFEKRFSKGYTFQLSYTWAKAMEAIEYLNVSDPLPYESISSLDRTHRLVASGIYELPFGRGRALGSNWHPVTNFVLDGWQLSGVVQRQSGAPLGFGNAIFNGDLKDIALPKSERSVDRWFNTEAGFNRNSAQQLANNIRAFPLRFSGIRNDGQARWDFSAIKNFKVTEKATMQFRAECFNAWNHPNLSSPNTTPTNSAFGTITGQNPPRSWQGALKLTF